MAGLTTDEATLAGLAEAEKHEVKYEKEAGHSLSVTVSKERSGELDENGNIVFDDIHEGLVFPTDEERRTLRRVADKTPWNAYLIAFVELVERFSYYGATVVFTNFIQQPLPPGSHTGAGKAHGQSGALGLGQRASTGLGTFNQFWVYVIPLFGAYIADTRWGRFKTICVCVGIALVGHILLIISAIPPVIVHPHGSLATYIIAIIIMGMGTGGFKSNISPLVAEQYKRTKLFVETTKNGEKVIVDPTLTTSRIYMYFYLFINIGALLGQIGMAYSEKYVGFWLSYLLPTVLFLLCPIILWMGNSRYAKSPPTGSILATAIRAWRYAARGRWSLNPLKCYRQLTAPDFWESTKPSKIVSEKGEEGKPKWMDFDDQWVDELKRGMKACAVFVWYPVYCPCFFLSF